MSEHGGRPMTMREIMEAEDSQMTEIPRRNRLDRMTPAERAITDAMQAVEDLPPDVRLTEAVVLLGKARDKVADFVDAQPAAPSEPSGTPCSKCGSRNTKDGTSEVGDHEEEDWRRCNDCGHREVVGYAAY